jgi:hypothetical protein
MQIKKNINLELDLELDLENTSIFLLRVDGSKKFQFIIIKKTINAV